MASAPATNSASSPYCRARRIEHDVSFISGGTIAATCSNACESVTTNAGGRVSRMSASASEIVAGAVKDTGSGTLVGMKTWGKGLVQTIAPISADGSAVLITTHRYYTSAMVDINKKGIEPDIESDVTEAGFAKYAKSRKLADDEQVQKAVSVIRRQLADRAALRE